MLCNMLDGSILDSTEKSQAATNGGGNKVRSRSLMPLFPIFRTPGYQKWGVSPMNLPVSELFQGSHSLSLKTH